jgi:hypothetical protein
VAMYVPFCGTLSVQPTASPAQAQAHMAEWWEPPRDLPAEDMTYGPWGVEDAPRADQPFTFRHPKTHGVSPGYEVEDDQGREWSVKFGDEGHVEVLLSRVLTAVGYHQPPVYYVNHFKLTDPKGTHDQPGARFRLKTKDLKDLGDWAWQQNPFVGTRPYQGLLVILMIFDSTDLKNSNNTLYEVRKREEKANEEKANEQQAEEQKAHEQADELSNSKHARRWYVVRDLGSALGETGRLDPKRNDPNLFSQLKFVRTVHDGFVEFSYHGWHQELYKNRLTPEDVEWACDLIGRLTDTQWTQAFAAAGYESEPASRFITVIKNRIEEGRHIGGNVSTR